jgi:hypothetical protein
MRSIVLGSIDTAQAAQRHAQLVIVPAVHGIDMMEFERIREIRDQGALAARSVLDNPPPTSPL